MEEVGSQEEEGVRWGRQEASEPAVSPGYAASAAEGRGRREPPSAPATFRTSTEPSAESPRTSALLSEPGPVSASLSAVHVRHRPTPYSSSRFRPTQLK